jgi:hypothetical protein
MNQRVTERPNLNVVSETNIDIYITHIPIPLINIQISMRIIKRVASLLETSPQLLTSVTCRIG